MANKVSTDGTTRLKALDINKLRNEIKQELIRRSGQGSVYGYGASDNPGFINAISNGEVMVEQYTGTIGDNPITPNMTEAESNITHTTYTDFNNTVDNLNR